MPDRFLGFDTRDYPGAGTMAWLWAHGFRVAGFYLNHRRGSERSTWMPHRAGLVSAGWGLAPIYLGWEIVDRHGSSLPAPAHGLATAMTDAAEAARLMRRAGFADGTTLYLDLEGGSVPSRGFADYVVGWARALTDQGFRPGVYCSHLVAAWAGAQDLPCWSFHIPAHESRRLDPANLPDDAIDEACIGTQIRQGVHIAGLPMAVDLSWFAMGDPSLPPIQADVMQAFDARPLFQPAASPS